MEAAVTESMWKADERGDAFDGVAMCLGDRTQSLGYGMKTAHSRSPLRRHARAADGFWFQKCGRAQSPLRARTSAFQFFCDQRAPQLRPNHFW